MSSAYSPGLKVLERTTIRRLRRLPLAGDVLVKQGDCVTAEQIVMRTNRPGPADMVNGASILGTMPDEIGRYLAVPQGSQLKKGEVMAMRKTFFGMFTARVEAPMDGMIEAVSPILKELNLSNEQANKLAGAYAAYAAQAQKAQHDQVAATLEGWKQEVLAWPRAQETLAVTRQAVLKYGGEHAANAFFSDPYLGSNPVVLRVLANMAARLGEDRMQDRAISAEGTKRDPAEILFGKK